MKKMLVGKAFLAILLMVFINTTILYAANDAIDMKRGAVVTIFSMPKDYNAKDPELPATEMGMFQTTKSEFELGEYTKHKIPEITGYSIIWSYKGYIDVEVAGNYSFQIQINSNSGYFYGAVYIDDKKINEEITTKNIIGAQKLGTGLHEIEFRLANCIRTDGSSDGDFFYPKSSFALLIKTPSDNAAQPAVNTLLIPSK